MSSVSVTQKENSFQKWKVPWVHSVVPFCKREIPLDSEFLKLNNVIIQCGNNFTKHLCAGYNTVLDKALLYYKAHDEIYQTTHFKLIMNL